MSTYSNNLKPNIIIIYSLFGQWKCVKDLCFSNMQAFSAPETNLRLERIVLPDFLFFLFGSWSHSLHNTVFA